MTPDTAQTCTWVIKEHVHTGSTQACTWVHIMYTRYCPNMHLGTRGTHVHQLLPICMSQCKWHMHIRNTAQACTWVYRVNGYTRYCPDVGLGASGICVHQILPGCTPGCMEHMYIYPPDTVQACIWVQGAHVYTRNFTINKYILFYIYYLGKYVYKLYHTLS